MDTGENGRYLYDACLSPSLAQGKKRSWLKQKICDEVEGLLYLDRIISHFVSPEERDSSYHSISMNSGGSFGIPFLNPTGVGGHGEGGISLNFNTRDPLNLSTSIYVIGATMVTTGGGYYQSGGFSYGKQNGNVPDGFDIETIVHTEVAFVPGNGGSAQIDNVLAEGSKFSDPISEIIEGNSFQASGRSAAGIAAMAGSGPGVKASYSVGNLPERMQNWYNNNCK
jgi:hypothetical protein